MLKMGCGAVVLPLPAYESARHCLIGAGLVTGSYMPAKCCQQSFGVDFTLA